MVNGDEKGFHNSDFLLLSFRGAEKRERSYRRQFNQCWPKCCSESFVETESDVQFFSTDYVHRIQEFSTCKFANSKTRNEQAQ